MILAALLGCATPAPAPPPVEHPATVAECAAERSEGLRTLCLVQVAADRARAADVESARAACAGVVGSTWADECHFRVGEELARAARMADGLGFCAVAGRFRTFCFTHAVWNGPAQDATLEEWEALGAPFADVQGVESLRARWWFNHYFGSGRADASEARAAPETSAAAARGAWALEAVRLTEGDLARARAAWSGPALTGPALEPPARVGRYDLPFPIEAERALPAVPGFGGSSRLVGTTPDEDLDIALLEGAWFREATGADTFAPYLDDPRPRVRYTAVRMWRSLPSDDAEAVARRLAEDADPIVRAHAEDALRYQTWRGKGKAPP